MTIKNKRIGIEIEILSEDRWSVRLTDLGRVPTVNGERDWSNADWPEDEEITRAIGCPVRFAALGDGLDEAIYERAGDRVSRETVLG